MFKMVYICLFMAGVASFDTPILIFLLVSPIFVMLRAKFKFISLYITDIILMITTFCLTLDHYSLDKNKF